MIFKKRRSFIATLGMGLIILMQASFGFAATTPKNSQTPVTNTSVLKISPLRTNVNIPAGTSQKVPVFIYNITSSPMVVQAIENDFIAGDESGKPALLLDPNSYAPTHSLKRFMIPLSNVTVPANSSTEVDVTITVPQTAQAGGYFGALRFAPASIDGSKSVNVGASVSSLILLTVPGDTVEKLTLTNFDVQQNGGTATNFRTPNDLALLLRFENKGNLQEAPFGQIYVLKGNKNVYSYNFNDNDPKSEILPDSARKWNVPLKGFSKFGKYTVGATIGYGTKSQNIEIRKTVWIIPTVYILAVVGAILLIVLLAVGLYLFLKSYKRKILRSSRRRY